MRLYRLVYTKSTRLVFMNDEVFDMTPADKPRKVTKLDELREALGKKIERPQVLIEVPERPSVKVLVTPNIEQRQLREWRKRAGEGTKNGMDTTLFSAILVATLTRGIYFGDEEMLSENGDPLTFASPEIKDMLDVTRPVPEGVKAMFGIDAHVEAAAYAIMEAAGLGDSVEVDDNPLTD